MKKILLASLTLLCASCAHTKQVSANPVPLEPAQAEPVPAKAEVTTPLPIEPFSSEPLPSELLPGDSILAFVRSKLPNDPLKLTGTLKVRTKKGFTKISLPVQMELNWGASTPSANYRIGDESLKITWQNDLPDYTFSNNRNTPTSNILGTGLTWADLSFSVLWWPNSKLIDEEKKINRECYVVDVLVPDSENTMRLWIEKKMGMLLEAQTLDAEENPQNHGNGLRSLRIGQPPGSAPQPVSGNAPLKTWGILV
jgi:hypothetical protein